MLFRSQSFSQLAGQNTAEGKALAIAATTIDTYVAAQSAYTAAAKIDPFVLAPLAAGAAIVAGLARVKAIADVQVPNSSGGGGNSISAPSTPQAPSLRAPASFKTFEKPVVSTPIEKQRVYVVETDITNAQRKVSKIQSKATIE